jgi:hypothetical protein
MDHRSFRAQLEFSIGFAIAQSRALLRRILILTGPCLRRRAAGACRARGEDVERSGFELDEDGQALRKHPPLQPHGMPRGE